MKVDIYNTDKKYNIIYADPPWAYKDIHTWRKMGGGVKGHYKTMNIKDIVKMKAIVKNIAAADCLLFMWVTFPNLKEGLEVIEEWGYIKKEEKNYVRYNNFGNTYFGEIIDFDLKNKKFRLTNKTCHGNTHFRYGNMQELQAIKKKCEELGWI